MTFLVENFTNPNNPVLCEPSIGVGMIKVPSGPIVAAGSSSSSIFSYISKKISNQMSNRAWTKQLIHNTVNKPYTTRAAVNKATGNPATAYFTKEGAYVVRDNVTGEIIQISNILDPKWIPDPVIVNPYTP